MKKRIRLLCAALSLLLLTPCVCAAASDGTNLCNIRKTQVRQELLSGIISDTTAVLQIATEYLNADIQETGITAKVDKNGCLAIIQISSNYACSDRILSSDDYSSKEIVCTTLLLADSSGSPISLDAFYYNITPSDSGGLVDYGVYATHTAYISVRQESLITALEAKMISMKTTLTYDSTVTASKLVQEYNARSDPASAVVTDRKTTNYPSETTYTFAPSNAAWYAPSSGNPGGYITSYATITVSGSSFVLNAGVNLGDINDLI